MSMEMKEYTRRNATVCGTSMAQQSKPLGLYVHRRGLFVDFEFPAYVSEATRGTGIKGKPFNYRH